MILLLRRRLALVYHGVGDVDERTDPRRLVVSPGHLESHVRLLRRLGYRFATATELLAGTPTARTAAITFDDGFRSWVSIVLPLLRRLGVRATFYPCTGWWGGDHPLVAGDAGRLVDEDDVRALAEAGMDLGSHSVSHPDLRRLDDAALAHELRASKAELERVTGRPCRTLAYPYGLFDRRVEAAAAAAGYELAWAWLPGPWRPFAAPRLAGPPRNGAGRLALKLLGLRRRRP